MKKIYKFSNLIQVKIKGKNIERFLRKLIQLDVELYNIKYNRKDEVLIKISKKDYDYLNKIKTIYDIEIVNVYGFEKIKKKIKKSYYLILSVIISIVFVIYLSNTIFSIDVVHNNKELRDLLINELRENDIKIFSFKKKYSEINKVKQNILKKYKEKIEWLEIENIGTKYIVRVEERIIKKEKKEYIRRDIVALKNALIMKVEADSGEIIKNSNEYVKKGETIITGDIKLYDESKNKTMAKGVVYGEVWYKVTVEYPLNYFEDKIEKEKSNTYIINFINKKIDLSLKKNQKINTKMKILYKHTFLPISFIKEEQKKIITIKQKLTKKQAIERAILEASKKISSKLNDKEFIISSKKLKVESNNSKIIVDIFFSVCEDITDYKIIE